MLKIRRFEDKGMVIFLLSGRIQEMHIPDLQKLLENEPRNTTVAIDLSEVRLVDRQVIKFLATCETKGLQLKNCPLYVRQSIDSGAGGSEFD